MPVRISGLDKLRRATSVFGIKLQARLVVAVGKTSEDVRDDAKVFSPKDTHSLEETITADPVEVDGDAVSARVTAGGRGVINPKTGKEVDYARHQEMGTSKMPAQPYMGPAAAKNREPHLARVKQALELTLEESLNE